MNRRRFLTMFGASAAAMVLDPELALWKPGAKTHILPPAGGWGMRVGDPGWMHPSSPVAQRIAAQYAHGKIAFHKDAFSMAMAKALAEKIDREALGIYEQWAMPGHGYIRLKREDDSVDFVRIEPQRYVITEGS